GVKPEERVAICMERGFGMVVGLLGVLKAGGAYVPLDPGYPGERLRYMLEDSRPVAILTEGHLSGLFEGVSEGRRVIEMGEEREWRGERETNPEREIVGVGPENLAYVIYTSGSTGTPKGVMVEHVSVVNTLLSTSRHLQLKNE